MEKMATLSFTLKWIYTKRSLDLSMLGHNSLWEGRLHVTEMNLWRDQNSKDMRKFESSAIDRKVAK